MSRPSTSKKIELSTLEGTTLLSRKATAFVAILKAGMSIDLAARQAGLSPRSGYRTWAKPEVKAHVVAAARDTLALGSARAAARIIELSQQTESKKVALEASELILSCNSIRAPAAAAPIQIGIGAVGYVIARAKRLITLWETRDRVTASLPQIAGGEALTGLD